MCIRDRLNRRCEIDLQVDAAIVEYSQPVEQTYSQPAQTYTETVVEQAPYQAPTPIESTQVVTQAPYQAPTPVTTTVPATPVASAPVSAPYVPATPPPPLPTVGGAGAGLGGISTPVLIGGLAAVVAAGIIIADDDDPSSP